MFHKIFFFSQMNTIVISSLKFLHIWHCRQWQPPDPDPDPDDDLVVGQDLRLEIKLNTALNYFSWEFKLEHLDLKGKTICMYIPASATTNGRSWWWWSRRRTLIFCKLSFQRIKYLSRTTINQLRWIFNLLIPLNILESMDRSATGSGSASGSGSANTCS